MIRSSTESSNNHDCDCQHASPKIIEVFKVSKHLTILLCRRCGKEIGRWEDKIKPFKREWFPEEQEAMQ